LFLGLFSSPAFLFNFLLFHYFLLYQIKLRDATSKILHSLENK
jgi:hypothetical protein